MLAGTAQIDMDVVFVGTVSCMPGTTRGVSCTALRLNWRRKADKGGGNGIEDGGGGGGEQRGGGAGAAGTWLFNCGESTQLSVQRITSIRPGRIPRITAMVITPLVSQDCSASWGPTARGTTPSSRYTDRKIHGNSSSKGIPIMRFEIAFRIMMLIFVVSMISKLPRPTRLRESHNSLSTCYLVTETELQLLFIGMITVI
jgi:hypothetical protein